MLELPVALVGWPGNALGKILWAAGSFFLPCLMLAGLYFVVRTISRRVFLIDLREDTRPIQELTSLATLEEFGESFLVLAGPAAVDLPLGAHAEVVSAVDWEPNQWGSSDKYERLVANGIKSVVIQNFDYKMEDADANRGKVEVLRELWARGIKTIVISRVNPVYFALNSQKPDDAGRRPDSPQSRLAPGSQAEYWENVFSSSLKVHLEPIDHIDAGPLLAAASLPQAQAAIQASASTCLPQPENSRDGSSSLGTSTVLAAARMNDSMETPALELGIALGETRPATRWWARFA